MGRRCCRPTLQSLCCVPLVTRRGTLGTLNVASVDPDAFPVQELDLLKQISKQVAIAMENALAYQEIMGLKDHLAEEKEYLEAEIQLGHDFRGIIGESSALKSVLQAVETVAPTDATVLIRGETGTGKEMLARAIHNLSSRRDRTFVRLNLAALPASLIESELFGYERGAFTGATNSKIGRLELANGGTLFLDEAGDIPPEIQPKLLRALQEKEFERLGSTRTQRVDVRLIAATNRDLEQMIADGLFRSDLYYRLNVFPMHVPPLRERPDDIPSLVHHFVDKFSRPLKRRITIIPSAAMEALKRSSLARQHSGAGEPDRARGHTFVGARAQGAARRSQTRADPHGERAKNAGRAIARDRAKADSHGAARVRRRDRRLDRSGRQAGNQADDAAVPHAKARNHPSVVLEVFVRHRAPACLTRRCQHSTLTFRPASDACRAVAASAA